jgi:hypothetical protein
MSKEHVFSNWINDVLPPDGTHIRVRTSGFDAAGGIRDPFHDATKYRQGSPPNAKARVVCEQCNSGWMGAIQDRTKPVLVPLIEGKGASIGAEAQAAISTWITMVSMTAEYLFETPKPAIPEADRSYLMQNAEPPKDWQIWIGYYIGTKRNLPYAQARTRISMPNLPIKSDDRSFVNTQITSLSIGKLYFYVYSAAVNGLGPIRLNQEVLDRLRTIWPSRKESFDWPPAVGVNDQNAVALNRVLLNALRPPAHESSPPF